MKIVELFAMCDESKPNQYGTEMKTQWLNEVEGIVVDEILNLAEGNDIDFEKYEYERDAERELMVPDRYCDLYLNYLFCKIDYMNAEYARYNNEVAMYNAAKDAYASYYRRTHTPKQNHSLPKI